MNYESPFIRYSVTALGTLVFGFFAFMSIVRPFGEPSSAPKPREQTASKIAALSRLPPSISVPKPEGIDAESYLVRLVGEPTPLLSRRELKRMPPASLTKLMTTLIAREELGPSDLVLFSAEAKAVDPIQSSVTIGESLLRDDAVKLALISSANDAAQALAEAAEKKRRSHSAIAEPLPFAKLMNEKATRIGMTDSHFQNPTGLHDPEHMMTATDVARLLEYVFRTDRGIFDISRTVETTVYSATRQAHTIENTDDLLKEFPAILGSKTGFTEAARGTLALLYPVKPNRTALIVIMGSQDRFSDGRKLIRWLENSF